MVKERFGQLWSNDDQLKVSVSRKVLSGDYEWMEVMPGSLLKP